jgi:hypothetical protein
MPRTRTARLVPALGLVALLLGGCFVEGALSVFVSEEGVVNISYNTDTDACTEVSPFSFTCSFSAIESDVEVLSPAELLFLLLLFDPMVVQFPDDVGGFTGSFLHDSGTSGPLVITAGLGSVPVDDDETLVAEPGTQLVILELPPGAPTTGNFSFNLAFAVPPGTTEVATKPVFTGRIELTDGRVFYAPLFPCPTDMSQVPTFTLPIPAPGDTVTIPDLDPALACDSRVYQYGLGGAAPFAIPTLGPGGLLMLVLLLGTAGWLALRR